LEIDNSITPDSKTAVAHEAVPLSPGPWLPEPVHTSKLGPKASEPRSTLVEVITPGMGSFVGQKTNETSEYA
jgi:hypothetical protein